MNTPQTNAITFADLTTIAQLLGSDTGKGRDTQIKMLMKLVEGAYHNAIDTDKSKHGADVDDAQKLAETYVKAQGAATVFDAKAPNQRKLISCFRTCIKLGMWPKGGMGEPLATMNNLISMRQALRKNPADAKKLDDAANTLLKYARAQLRSDQLLDDAQLREFCFRKGVELRTAEEIIEAARKSLRQLYEGKASHNTASDNSKHIANAIESLTKRLKENAGARGRAAGPNVQLTV